MQTLDGIREYFSGDHFAAGQGIVIECAEDGRAVCSVELRDGHRNALGHPQGGLIFTLADFAFAVAANFAGQTTVTLDSTIHYLKAAKGTRLTATATCTSRSRAVCVYQITVQDNLETPVATVTATGYIRR